MRAIGLASKLPPTTSQKVFVAEFGFGGPFAVGEGDAGERMAIFGRMRAFKAGTANW